MNLTTPFNRRTLLGGATGVSIAALAGCSGTPGGTTGPATTGGATTGPSGTVAHWDLWQSQAAYIENEIKLFQEATGVIVDRTQQQTGAYPQLLTLGARSGDLPDTRFLSAEPTFNKQVDDGWLMALNDLVDDDWVRTFPPYSFIEGSNMVDGKIYTAPFEANTAPWVFLFVNNQVFKDAGLVDDNGDALVPQTWDDVTDYAKQITEKSGGKVTGLGLGNGAFNILTWWAELFLAGETPTGGFGIDLRTGGYSMGSDPVVVEFLNLFKSWKDDGLFFPSSMTIDDETARVYFAQGQFGMTVGGVWNLPGWAADGFTDYSITTLLTKTGTPKSYFYSAPGGQFWVMNAETENPEAALAWYKWLHSPEAGARYAQDFGIGLSVHPEANDPSKIKDQNFAAYVAASEGKQIPGPQPGVRNPDTALVVVDAVTPDSGDVVAGFFTDQIKDLGAALKDLEDRKNAAQEAGIKAAAEKGANVSAEDWVFGNWDPTQPYAYENIAEFPTL